jgi:1-acyl-sn-glycerol-3-phosphate acyltransferase
MGKIYGFGIFPLMGVDIHHHHTEKFNQIPGAAILIANHQENFDTFLIGCFCPKYTVSVGKRSILWVPLFGLVYYLAGNILINRKNRREALRSMDHAGQTVVDKKVKILIMPEGTRSRGKGLGRFKKGAFHLAIKFQLPILPIAVSQYSDTVDLNKLKSGTIHLEVLDVIETKGKTLNDLQEVTDLARQKLAAAVQRLDQL